MVRTSDDRKDKKKTMSPERDIYELELLAIAECLKHWRPYLAGSPHEIIVHTDHANLTY